MKYNVYTTPPFKKSAKRLIGKYPQLKTDIRNLADSLKENPIQGDSLGKDCYKVRMKITSKNTGKSGGVRIIINVQIIHNAVHLLTIYDKAEKSDLFSGELDKLLGSIL
jgi:mRNA-degrading endonuclease RelE of RelBE toxin-antitoxin system